MMPCCRPGKWRGGGSFEPKNVGGLEELNMAGGGVSPLEAQKEPALLTP